MSELSYSESISELEDILRKMQDPDCDIDRLSGYTSRALELLRRCKEKLTKTNEEVRRTLSELNV